MTRPEIPRNASSIATRSATVAAIAFAIISTSVFLASAGTLTPPGPPASTMRTLEEQKPAWNKIIPVAQRFVDALDGTAVLDKETGLVWAKAPDKVFRNWQTAIDFCTQLYLGGRMGWRLPTIVELGSLVDRSTPDNIKLPLSHPFQNIEPTSYWSANIYLGNPNKVWALAVGGGGTIDSNNDKTGFGLAWPVRSGL